MATAPTNVVATVTVVGGVATAIEVTWTNNGDPNYDTIELYRNGVSYAALAGDAVSYSNTSFSFDATYYYAVKGTIGGVGSWTSANSNTVTPKQLIAPTINSLAGTGDAFYMTWTNNGSVYNQIDIRKRESGGAWGTATTLGGTATSYSDFTFSANQKYGYAIQGTISGYGSAESAELLAANWTATITDTLTLTGSVAAAGLLASVEVTDTLTLTDTISVYKLAVVSVADVLTLTDTTTASSVFNVTISDTLTLSDVVYVAQTIRTNYGYYLAGQPGTTYHHDASYLSDNTTPISCEWRSKRIDFADQDPEALGKWKTLFRVRVHYEDLAANTTLALRVSVDGGTTWTTQSATMGTGDLAIKEKDFFFIVTGRMFNFSLISASASNASKVIALEAEYEVGGEYFAVS